MKNSDKKERKEEILVGHKVKYDQIIHKGDGETYIRLLSGEIVKPNSLISSLKHERESGKEKIITRLSDQATFNTLDFLKKYKHVFFIDTNTKLAHGKEISVATIVEVKDFRLEDVMEGKKVKMQKSNPWHILFVNKTEVHSEKIAIALLIDKLKKNPNYPDHIGLISDHELGKHPKYNRREIPLFGSFHLPIGYELAYASADKKDSLFNRLMIECDIRSSKILNDLEKNGKFIFEGKEILLEKIKVFENTNQLDK